MISTRRWKKRDIRPVETYTCVCLGKRHRIELTDDCAVKFCDHADDAWEDLLAFAALGGRVRCLIVATRELVRHCKDLACKKIGAVQIQGGVLIVPGDGEPFKTGRPGCSIPLSPLNGRTLTKYVEDGGRLAWQPSNVRCKVGHGWLLARGWPAALLDHLGKHEL